MQNVCLVTMRHGNVRFHITCAIHWLEKNLLLNECKQTANEMPGGTTGEQDLGSEPEDPNKRLL